METEHRKYFIPIGIGFLHTEQTANCAGTPALTPHSWSVLSSNSEVEVSLQLTQASAVVRHKEDSAAATMLREHHPGSPPSQAPDEKGVRARHGSAPRRHTDQDRWWVITGQARRGLYPSHTGRPVRGPKYIKWASKIWTPRIAAKPAISGSAYHHTITTATARNMNENSRVRRNGTPSAAPREPPRLGDGRMMIGRR